MSHMHNRVTVQRRVSPARRDEVKQEIVEWEDVSPKAVAASVEALSGREFWQAQQAQSAVSHAVEMCYFPGLTTQHRLKWLPSNRILNIESVTNDDGRNRKLTLRCVEHFEQQQARGY